MLTDIPYKILNAIFSNLVLYFMTNLRREPGQSPLIPTSLAPKFQLTYRGILLLPAHIVHGHSCHVDDLPLHRSHVEAVCRRHDARSIHHGRTGHLHWFRHPGYVSTHTFTLI